jgi:hypothetical protein
VRFRWPAASLLAAVAILVPIAPAQACDLTAQGAKNAADGGTDVRSGDSIRFELVRIDEEARYSIWVNDRSTGELLFTVVEDAPAPKGGSDHILYRVGDLGAQERDLKVTLQVKHSDGGQKPINLRYVGRFASSPGPQPNPSPETDSGRPAASVQPGPPPESASPDTPSAPPTASPPSARGGGPTETFSSPPPDSSGPSGSSATLDDVAGSHPRARAVANANASDHQHARAAAGQPLAGMLAKPSDRRATPAKRTVAPRPDRADSPRTVPRVTAAELDQGLEPDVPAVIVAVVLGSGIAVLLRFRRRPGGWGEIVAVPIPPPTPDAAELAIEAELQEILAEAQAQTLCAEPNRDEGVKAHDGPRARSSA